ncbi:hypothetical protein [Prosthecobacter dejongeii]|uniref:Uncharacterized protein n=1 Tax=Prosthecobacter dejongeii TaxID=48465 RepID=A0A7W7YMC6_9BACT|nr:hypothetical protein [Prosthecobacter dejongeii]MBB5038769.1 hypothetical protein [Prosthecobacter dejongeii]
MKLSLLSLVVLSLAFVSVSCSTEERDGRKYYGASTPLQSRMGVQFVRVKTTTPEPAPAVAEGRVSDGTLFGSVSSNEPAGLLDRNQTPDEPGTEYRIHAQHSPNPLESRMGVRVSRRKK